MKTGLTTLFLFFCSTVLFAQHNPDYQKLSKACELWGLIKYFHPDKPGADFDSAFAAHVPAMLEAKTDMDWYHALNAWLGILQDANTQVVSTDLIREEEGNFSSTITPDSILYINISGTKIYQDRKEILKFAADIREQRKKAGKGIIIDLRNQAMIPLYYYGFFYMVFDALPELYTENVPQYQSTYYTGFVPDAGNTSGGYEVKSVLRNAAKAGSFQKGNQRVVWIVNRHTELPMMALAQQASGVGMILSDTSDVEGMLPLASQFSVTDKLTALFKTSDIVLPKAVRPIVNHVYADAEDPLAVARKFLTNWPDPRPGEAISPKALSTSRSSYPKDTYPSIGYRVLAAAKIFTVIENFFPYYELMDRPWRDVFLESLPEFVAAANDIAYGLAVAKMYANIDDTHGMLMRGNKAMEKLQGEASAPFAVEWIEQKMVVTKLLSDSTCRSLGISVGDIVVKANGVSMEELMKQYALYFAHSNEASLRELAALYCTSGPDKEEGMYTIEDKNGKQKEVKIRWSVAYEDKNDYKPRLDTLALLPGNIGYADLTRMVRRQTDEMFEKFKDTKAIIFDMRGYPKLTAWTIAPRLTEKKNVPVAMVRTPEVLSPNVPAGPALVRKSYTEFLQRIDNSDKWKYKGKTVMLIDEKAQSQAESTGLFFEAMNNTTFIGSPTGGADGDVTRFQIPGGMTLNFSGQAVYHADKRQLQRVGLQPHVFVRPTIKGIRAGKDEVLDKAIWWVNQNVK